MPSVLMGIGTGFSRSEDYTKHDPLHIRLEEINNEMKRLLTKTTPIESTVFPSSFPHTSTYFSPPPPPIAHSHPLASSFPQSASPNAVVTEHLRSELDETVRDLIAEAWRAHMNELNASLRRRFEELTECHTTSSTLLAEVSQRIGVQQNEYREQLTVLEVDLHEQLKAITTDVTDALRRQGTAQRDARSFLEESIRTIQRDVRALHHHTETLIRETLAGVEKPIQREIKELEETIRESEKSFRGSLDALEQHLVHIYRMFHSQIEEWSTCSSRLTEVEKELMTQKNLLRTCRYDMHQLALFLRGCEQRIFLRNSSAAGGPPAIGLPDSSVAGKEDETASNELLHQRGLEMGMEVGDSVVLQMERATIHREIKSLKEGLLQLSSRVDECEAVGWKYAKSSTVKNTSSTELRREAEELEGGARGAALVRNIPSLLSSGMSSMDHHNKPESIIRSLPGKGQEENHPLLHPSSTASSGLTSKPALPLFSSISPNQSSLLPTGEKLLHAYSNPTGLKSQLNLSSQDSSLFYKARPERVIGKDDKEKYTNELSDISLKETKRGEGGIFHQEKQITDRTAYSNTQLSQPKVNNSSSSSLEDSFRSEKPNPPKRPHRYLNQYRPPENIDDDGFDNSQLARSNID